MPREVHRRRSVLLLALAGAVAALLWLRSSARQAEDPQLALRQLWQQTFLPAERKMLAARYLHCAAVCKLGEHMFGKQSEQGEWMGSRVDSSLRWAAKFGGGVDYLRIHLPASSQSVRSAWEQEDQLARERGARWLLDQSAACSDFEAEVVQRWFDAIKQQVER